MSYIRKNFILTFILIIYLFGVALLFFNRIVDAPLPINCYIIASESMAPKLKPGDLICVLRTEKESLKVGDIISYKYQNIIITHRIIKINNSELIAKGDSNNVEDLPIKIENVVGKYLFSIPKLGYIYMLLKIPLINLVIDIVLLVTILYEFKKECKNEK